MRVCVFIHKSNVKFAIGKDFATRFGSEKKNEI